MRDYRSSADAGSSLVSPASCRPGRFSLHVTTTIIEGQSQWLLPLRLSGTRRATDAVAAHGLSAQLHRGIS
ncbi:MAG: hypothetical protein ACSLE1_22685 [Sphingobium sp.]